MSGIVDLYHKKLGLKWYGGIQHFFDGVCFGDSFTETPCCECHLFPLPDGRQRLDLDCDNGIHYDAIACHFMATKSKLEKSLADDDHFNTLLHQQSPSYRLNFLEGTFDVFEEKE
jgi:hypothetical protein